VEISPINIKIYDTRKQQDIILQFSIKHASFELFFKNFNLIGEIWKKMKYN
jgi:hypothetical protein